MPWIEVDIDLDDFHDDDLIEEIEGRGYQVTKDPIPQNDGFTRERILYIMEMLRTNTDMVKDSVARDLYHDLRGML